MTLTNTQTDTLINAIISDKSLEGAALTFTRRVDAMAQNGWTVDVMDEHKPLVMRIAAERILTAKDLALFNDDTKAQKVKGPEGKQVRTARGSVVHRVDQTFGRLRKALAGAAERGVKAVKSRSEVLADYVTKIANSIRKDHNGDATPDLTGHKEILARLKAVNDLLPQPIAASFFDLSKK